MKKYIYKNNQKLKKAFTLIELLIVIAIIGILFIVLVSKVDFATNKAKTAGVQTDFRSFQLAFETVAREHQGFSSLVDEDYEQLEMAINKNLDNKLKIHIDVNGTITMANHATDPWNVPYHGYYIEGTDGWDLGAIIMYSNGPDLIFGSEHSIQNGKVAVIANSNAGKDDLCTVSCYSFVNGYGEVDTSTNGFSNNQMLSGNEATGEPPVIDRMQYVILDGANQNVDEYKEVVFRSDADYKKFIGVKLNGEIVDPSNYIASEGSTIITFKREYIESLENGIHSIEVVSNDGSAECDFSVGVVEPNDDGCWYDSLYYVQLTGTWTYGSSSTTLDRSVGFMMKEDGTFYVLHIDNLHGNNVTLTQTTPTVNNGVYTFSIQNFEFSGIFTNEGSTFECTSAKVENKKVPDYMVVFELQDIAEINNGNYILCQDVDYFYLYVNSYNGYCVFPKTNQKQYIKLKQTIFGIPVVALGVGSFSNSQITSIGVTGSGADLELHYNISKIDSAFENCQTLQTAFIPNSIVQVGYNAFNNCTNLHTVVFEEGVKIIDTCAFQNTGIIDLEFPNSLTSIYNSAFNGCSKMQRIKLVDNLSINSFAFTGCTSLTELVVPGSIRYIDGFGGCTGLQTIILMEGVKTIAQGAFQNCISLTNLVLPSSLEIISSDAFAAYSGYSMSIAELTLPEGVKRIEFHAFSSSNIKNVKFPSTIEYIDNDAFVKFNGDEPTTYEFNGTISEWTSKNLNFKYNVMCTDGLYEYEAPAPAPDSGNSGGCVTADTLILMADGTYKRIDELTYDDLVMVWNFKTGTYDAAPISIIFYHGHQEWNVVTLSFSDGSTLRIINTHGLFSVEDNNYVYIGLDNIDNYVGKEFVKYTNGEKTMVTLVDYNTAIEYTGSYCLQTACTNNYIADNMFSLTQPDYDGWFDYFAIGDNMKYDEGQMQADIELYGLYTYEDFVHTGITYEQFLAFNGPYLKVLVGRGVLTFEDIELLINIYIG